mgnify:CR=1 FL=1
MKKLLLAISLIVLLVLGGCVAPTDTDYKTDIDELEIRLNDLEQKYLDIEDYLDRQVFAGYVLPKDNGELNAMRGMVLSLETMVNEKDYIDKTKTPDYIWDLSDEYIKANEMANALAKKARATVSHANPILKDKGY